MITDHADGRSDRVNASLERRNLH